ncbi:alpha-1,2-fucosyltransferase [Arthrobacter psychrochitiniphilus]|uniref:alpha-1,2-fucosyltransferase n=1 Tax=Arthrobacter psychrochitiniphilus TaxID=291045 RepID=UPI003F7BCE0C
MIKRASPVNGTPVSIISIQGGLGNQLFEWAFAYALASSGSHVVIDTVRCRGKRPLEIGALLSKNKMLAKPWGYTAVLAEKAQLLEADRKLATRWRLVRESGFGHDPQLLETLLTPARCTNYVLGYFQSPKYFAGYEDEVRTAVSGLLTGMLTRQGVAMARELAASEDSVAVHVRRGDYISNSTAAAHHGSLQGNYYKHALSAMRDLGKTKILWFSDDTDWVRDELARPEDMIATPALTAELTTRAGGEIALMAACSSRVVANSSFSWWAGWLGHPATEQSPVAAPQQWLAGSANPALDLVPAHWLRF